MKKIKKILILCSLFFIVLLLASYLFLPTLFKPKIQGELSLSGLEHPVTVLRDRFGVPHIKAQSKKDLFLAFGYVSAQDRLFQMDIIRRTGAGRLSEIFGDKTLKADVLLRSLKIRKTAEESFKRFEKHYDQEMIELTNAYLKGVDSYIDNGKLPLEFTLLNYRPGKFSIIDMLSVPGYMALTFAEPIETDPLISQLNEKLSPELMKELRLETKALPRNTKVPQVSFTSQVETLKNIIPLFHGSNAWGVSSKRSTTGKPILANDPHIAFANPSVWYEAHLSAPGYDVYGYFLPLIPFPCIGQNSKASWTVTMSEVDDMDLYEEIFSKEKPTFYKFKNMWKEATVEHETILVKGAKPFSFDLLSTDHGPLLDQTMKGIEGKHVSLKWSYHHPDNDPLTAFYKLHQAQTVNDFKEALAHAAGPGLNMIFANTQGDLAQWVMGKIPRREKSFSSDRILNGTSGEDEYLGYLSIDENPHQINPSSGQIVTTNWRPDGDHNINGFWQPSDRYERIHYLLNQKEKWSPEEMKSIHQDTYAQYAPLIVPILLASMKIETQEDQEIFNTLKSWDGFSDVDSVGATIFHAWNQSNFSVLLGDKLSEQGLKSFCRSTCWSFYKKIMANKNSPWWENKRDEKLRSGLEISKKFLHKSLGGRVSYWKWGKLHTLTFEHPMGKVKWLAPVFNLGPYAAPGAKNTVNNMGFVATENRYEVKVGPSTRRIISLADLDKMITIIPTGNSGNRFSSHHKDQIEVYLKGEYRESRLSKPEEPYEVLNLIP